MTQKQSIAAMPEGIAARSLRELNIRLQQEPEPESFLAYHSLTVSKKKSSRTRKKWVLAFVWKIV